MIFIIRGFLLATEEGIVLKTGPETALVKTQKSSSCESCSSKDSCHSTGGRDMEVEVINTANAKDGDQVVINFETSSLLKASFLLHIFPILCMIAGAVLGQEFAESRGMDLSLVSAAGAFLFFILSFIIVRLVGDRMAKKNEYKPKIIRVKRRSPIQKIN